MRLGLQILTLLVGRFVAQRVGTIRKIKFASQRLFFDLFCVLFSCWYTHMFTLIVFMLLDWDVLGRLWLHIGVKQWRNRPCSTHAIDAPRF